MFSPRSARPRIRWIPTQIPPPELCASPPRSLAHPSACEIQASAFCRRYPSLRVASLRFHAITPDHLCSPSILAERGGEWKDLWGWVSLSASTSACLLGLTTPTETFPIGHEAFFIVAGSVQPHCHSRDLLREKYPEVYAREVAAQERGEGKWEGIKGGNVGLISTEKAERMLEWREGLENIWSGSGES